VSHKNAVTLPQFFSKIGVFTFVSFSYRRWRGYKMSMRVIYTSYIYNASKLVAILYNLMELWSAIKAQSTSWYRDAWRKIAY